jgi:hypothetical protein
VLEADVVDRHSGSQADRQQIYSESIQIYTDLYDRQTSFGCA